MFFILCNIPFFGMKIQCLNKPSILSNEQSFVQHEEEKEIVDNQNCETASCLY